MRLKVVVDQQHEFQLEEVDHSLVLDGKIQDYSIHHIDPRHAILYCDHKVYDIRVLSSDYPAMILNINGHEIQLMVKDHLSQILEKLGMDLDIQEVVDGIDAPMPGAILEVAVAEGAEVKKGDTLLILEAMKMENVLKSPADGVITAVHVKPGDNVEKNFRLISF